MIIILTLIVIYIDEINSKQSFFLSGLIIFLIGIYFLGIQSLAWNQNDLNCYLKTRIRVKGKIVKVKPGIKKTKYILDELEFLDSDKQIDKRILITHWKPEPQFQKGTKVKVATKLTRPIRQRNPGGFSYRNYLRRRKICAVGEVKNSDIDKLYFESNIFINLLSDLRLKVSKLINCYFNPPKNYLLQALIIGQKSKLPDKIKNTFQKLGCSHLLVISGLHLGLISYLLFQLTSGFDFGFQIVITELFLTSYLLVTGLQLSTLRAWLLITLTIIGQYLNRRTDLYNLLAGTGIIILLINPQFLFTVSFQLSLGSVAGIAHLSPLFNYYFNKLPAKISELLAATLAVQISLFPILSYYFNQISLVGLLANLVLMPLFSIILVLGNIFSFIGLFIPAPAELISKIINIFLKFGLSAADWMAAHLDLVFTVATPEFGEIIIYYIIVYYFKKILDPVVVPYSKQYSRYLAVIAVSLIVLLIFNFGSTGDQLEVTFLEVNGDSAYLNTPGGKKILIDGGKEGQKIINFLRSKGVNKLDLIFISHFHQDHVGGLMKIIDKFKVSKICYPAVKKKNQVYFSFIKKAEKLGIKMIKLDRKDKINLSEVKIKVLGPGKLFSDSPFNNNSLVLQFIYKKIKLLFTGDIESPAEQRLIKNNTKLKTTILKVPHHGSNTSSSFKLLKELNPEIAVIPVGVNNIHGHPDEAVISKLKKLKIKFFRTDKDGAVTIITGGNKYKYRSYLR